MSILVAALTAQALATAQWSFFGPGPECRNDPDSFECFCESARNHRVCRGDTHYLDLSNQDQDWVCQRFPDYRWCPDPDDFSGPDRGYFHAIVDYRTPQWQLELYYTDYDYPPSELAECVVSVFSPRGEFSLNGEVIFHDGDAFILSRNQFGSPPLGSPRYVHRLRIECRLASSGAIIRETLRVSDTDLGAQRWATLR
ncbi:MAG: hypothetical protein GYB36_08575 [Alphaproteobacteria bacterium]|nr:hypothetical protein [Alphaproteobacteria bacterium]